ncbi:MAG: PD-(D/E)XK nuclease family protein [Anaerolineales bacterium]|nr:PD-(D/E)XK nuclease family protein [Anaerolineales bacterium]
MKLPIPSLHLNQSNLQDYLDCPRRFQLSVLKETSWPAAYSEPIGNFEISTLRGNRFHLLCHQFFSGITPQILKKSISDPDLLSMWDPFLTFAQSLENYRFFSESLLSIPFHGHRLIAKFDLIVEISPEQYIIFDWKTASSKPSRSLLNNRLQTYLYPFIFSQAGQDLFPGNEIQPSLIEMHYWYPLASDHEEVFHYSDIKHQELDQKLQEIIQSIADLVQGDTDFQLTDNLSHCQFCVFRSLCDRGSTAGSFENSPTLDQEDLSNVHFDFDKISEIEF